MPTGARFYNSSTGKSNTLIVSNGNDDGYGGISFGGPYRSSMGQKGISSPLEIYSQYGISLSSTYINDYITYTTATDTSNQFQTVILIMIHQRQIL